MEVQSLEGTWVLKGKNQTGEKEQVMFWGLREVTFGKKPFGKSDIEKDELQAGQRTIGEGLALPASEQP